MNKVIQYDIEWYYDDAKIEPVENGEYVLYTDYQKLLHDYQSLLVEYNRYARGGDVKGLVEIAARVN